ncbi:glutamyl-tRNA reductase [Corynebacterium anserum]|uniref:Glutamyl-tRNA reductase n=1 Tax=Corynebacterium anserum TaxID=2684406 RepID=A0A7G7YQ71_9CORY|nr:glutamyl-tRNA reductase [Corynebacterium anserum]MBC2682312.1 glutamyl-tRNA reductase [Corynebacterium anserum]QNH96641.1 glutamyl-tRNA reductase [Corynebacterium anserum]
MDASAATGTAAVLLVGLSFRSAPVPILEKVSVADTDLPKLQLSLLDNDVISEALVLSTCNRMEFYTVANAFHSGLDHVVETIADFSGLPVEDLEPHLYVHYSDAAAEHMLNVASGLDSMVVGEQQIIGQLRTAYQQASQIGTVGRTLHDLSQRALRTGKRVHTETNIDTAGASMVSFSIDKALDHLDIDATADTPLAGRRALIIGAGAMASLSSTHLGKLGIDQVIVANRTLSRAENLVAHAQEAGVQATAVPLERMPEAMADVDIVVSATGAVGCVVLEEHVRCAHGRRNRRPLVLVDLSMPRDIDQATAELPNVHLLNIEQLTTMAGEGVEDEDPARRIVAEELDEFIEQQRAQAVVPTVKALRQKAVDLLADELLALERQTPTMSEHDREQVERSMRKLVDKLLHTPTVQAKKLSASGQAVSYPDALAALFQLPTGVIESVTEARVKRVPAQRAGNHSAALRIPNTTTVHSISDSTRGNK